MCDVCAIVGLCIGQWGDVTDVCVNYGAVGVAWVSSDA